MEKMKNDKHKQNEYKEESGGVCLDGGADGAGGGLSWRGVGESLLGDGRTGRGENRVCNRICGEGLSAYDTLHATGDTADDD